MDQIKSFPQNMFKKNNEVNRNWLSMAKISND
jgi:hypothetical protein